MDEDLSAAEASAEDPTPPPPSDVKDTDSTDAPVTTADQAAAQSEPVLEVLPLGSGLVLIGLGLGLAFIGLRLRRGD
ncbi:hypothetical protein AB0I00_24990 [Streptomyces sp. NPDC050803]|uniref:hypothetical protein n=1 Tax=unclassified Streptomyces TaxID=2593676 RepID=UPI00342E4DDF